MNQIPVFPDRSSNWTQEILLDGQIYTLDWAFDIRNGFFHLSVSDRFGGRVDGVKVVPHWPLLRQSKYALTRLPGDIMLLPVDSSAPVEYSYEDFGDTWVPYYMTADEITAWEVDNGLR